MLTLITVILIFASILIIAVILLQPGKGDLTANFGGISSQFGAVFGMQRATDLLGKITKWIAAIILLLALLANRFFVGPEEAKQVRPVTQGAQIPAQQPGPLQPPPVQPPNP